MKREIKKLRRENGKLKKRGKKDSTNSSLAPFFDDFKKKTISNKEKSDKKIGGQLGHKLHSSTLDNNPTSIVKMFVDKAPSGATASYNENIEIAYYVTQEIDLIISRNIIETSYYIDDNAPSCFDEIMIKYKINSVCYSSHFKSLLLYLNSQGTIPLDRLCLVIKELSQGQIDVKASSIVNWAKKFSIKANTTIKALQEELLKSKSAIC